MNLNDVVKYCVSLVYSYPLLYKSPDTRVSTARR